MSSKKETDRTLERFLCAFANHVEDPQPLKELAWLQGHPRFSAMLPRHPEGWIIGGNTTEGDATLVRARTWREHLRGVWREPCPDKRRAKAAKLILLYGEMGLARRTDAGGGLLRLAEIIKCFADHKITEPGLEGDAFLDALYLARDVSDKMRTCGNPFCGHTFFLAKRSSDRYCSKPCAAKGHRESKRRSWNRNWKRWPSTRWRSKGGRKKYPRKGKRQ